MLRIHLTLLVFLVMSSSSGADDGEMLSGTPHRNNVSSATELPVEFDVSEGTNIKWKVALGSFSYGNPIIADGQIFVGTNNGNSYLRRFPANVDLGCLLCFRESDGEFLWQYSARKLPTGRVHDRPLYGISSSPCVEGDRMWFVSNRGDVVCLDTKGYYDEEDDGSPRSLDTSSVVFTAIDDLRPSALPDDNARKKLRSQTLQSIFSIHTDELHGCVSRTFNLNDHSWVVRLKNPQTQQLEQQLYQLTFEDEQFAISHKVSPEEVSTTSYASRLTDGLESGTVSRPLVDLFKSRQITMAARPIVKTLEQDRHWKLRGIQNGEELEFELTLDENVLTCNVTRNSDDLLKDADVAWSYDMMGQLGVSQHSMANCSPLVYGDLLFLCTSNGVDESHLNIPAPNAPSFIAMNKNTGEVVWSDNSPGQNILHGQWSSPAIGVFAGVPQVIFPGGDGWIYSFQADEGKDGKPILLWKFDGNPKNSKWVLSGNGTRNNIIAPPVIYDQKVYIVMGQDPEHGSDSGHLWCIDPTKRGDINAELAVDKTGKKLPPRRLQAVDVAQGEAAIPNPNSGVVWHFHQQDTNGDGKIGNVEEIHRSLASPVIEDGLLYLVDYYGLLYCLDASSGKIHWTHDLFSPVWATPLIADGKVFVGDEDGDLTIFKHSRTKTILNEIQMESSIKISPVAAGNTLYIGTLSMMYAISKQK